MKDVEKMLYAVRGEAIGGKINSSRRGVLCGER